MKVKYYVLFLTAMVLIFTTPLTYANTNSDDNNEIIATFGKEREFNTEDERQKWFDEIDIVGNALSIDLQKYMHPDGPIIMHGRSYNGYITVYFLEGSKVNDSLMNEIYDTIDQRAVQNGIEDIPVEFRFESIPREDIDTLNGPSFTLVSLVMALLFVLKRKQK